MLSFRSVSKRFGGIQALRDVSFDVAAGEIHAVVGANGAGKSTLLKILSGVIAPDAGEIRIEGRPVRIGSPWQAQRLGIGLVPQETTLCENLTIAENVFLGRFRWLRMDRLAEQTRAMLAELGLDFDPRAKVGSLSVGQKQLVQIVRARVDQPRILALDEPTASLSEGEVERLFRVLRGLRAKGVTMFFVSHRLKEIQAVADRATVMRDGQVVATVDAKAAAREELVRHMAGREVEVVRGGSSAGNAAVLEVRGLSGEGFSDVHFSLRRGEILGWFGLVGAGRTETARALFGLDPARGEMDGRPLDVRSPRRAIARGIVLVPEDRKKQGLVLKMAVGENLTLPMLREMVRGGFIPTRHEASIVRSFIERLRIRCAGPEQRAGELSGGNQQKIVLAKWLEARPRVLILDEPTKGVDLAAKAEIHTLMREVAAGGAGVILISSELDEVRALADRILVFRAGRVNGEFPGTAADAELMSAAT
ncbi:MAG TPA: sugar ABC transporter ATP-binding protein [Planctomycetota bacterium]|nr:sugar ABC transporter ATP-binding protein [Planctomycetota bacterium]